MLWKAIVLQIMEEIPIKGQRVQISSLASHKTKLRNDIVQEVSLCISFTLIAFPQHPWDYTQNRMQNQMNLQSDPWKVFSCVMRAKHIRWQVKYFSESTNSEDAILKAHFIDDSEKENKH